VALEHGKALRAAGEFEPRRRNQAREWMWTLVEEGLQQAFRSDPRVASRIDELESEVAALQTTPAAAARALLASFAKR
jgi:LAO/AO transport system kinase